MIRGNRHRRRTLGLWLGVLFLAAGLRWASAVEIPLETLSPVRIGYIDLQKVFDTYPEKAFAEGDLLKEIQKRRTEMNTRQNAINVMRQQIASDQAALDQAKTGKPVLVPKDDVAALQPVQPAPPPPTPEVSTTTQVNKSSAAVEPYPTEEPLAGLPGHDMGSNATSNKQLPGMQPAETKSSSPLLGPDLRGATGPGAR